MLGSLDAAEAQAGEEDEFAQGLWTQREAAAYCRISERYLRSSDCPKILLPGSGPKRKPIVRYSPRKVQKWIESHSY